MEFYRVPHNRWVKLASMHIEQPAARWLPSVESRLQSCTWIEFSKLLLDRFGREHHELLVRQFLCIRQSGLVSEYIERFAILVDQLSAYESRADPLYFTMRFIDGLRDDLRAVVLIQRPPDLDTAFVLAQLQEEVAPQGRRKEIKKSDFSFMSKYTGGSHLPLPAPPLVDKASHPTSEDMKNNDLSRGRSTDDRWKALRAHRRAQGLCQFCAEKWSRGHSCAEKIHLHALQELCEVFDSPEEPLNSAGTAASDDTQLFLTLSVAVVSGQPSAKSMCLLGLI